MGTSSFALPALRMLVKKKLDVVAIYTQPPRRAGRGNKIQISSVGRFAQENKIQLFYPENFSDSSDINKFRNLKPDLVFVVAYGLILPKELLAISTIGYFNIHASLLPRWRGAAPIQRAILSGDKKTGVCIIKLEPSLDTGPIVMESQLEIISTDNAGSLHEKLSIIGSDLAYNLYENYNNLNYRVQEIKGITYAKKIEKYEARIDWSVSAKLVDQQIRAFSPTPGAWFEFGGERIKILACQVSNGKGRPGCILDEYFQVACDIGSVIPTILQRSGRSPLRIEDFLRGFKVPVGMTIS